MEGIVKDMKHFIRKNNENADLKVPQFHLKRISDAIRDCGDPQFRFNHGDLVNEFKKMAFGVSASMKDLIEILTWFKHANTYGREAPKHITLNEANAKLDILHRTQLSVLFDHPTNAYPIMKDVQDALTRFVKIPYACIIVYADRYGDDGLYPMDEDMI